MLTPRRALLVRHCQSSGPDPEASLTSLGCHQADVLAIYLRHFNIDHLVSSPFRRALQTVEPFAYQAQLPIHVNDHFAERRLAVVPLANWLEQIRQSFVDFDHRALGGESSWEAQRRGRIALEATFAQGHATPVIVTHGNLLTLILHSIDPSVNFSTWEKLTNPDVYLIETDLHGRYSFQRVWEENFI